MLSKNSVWGLGLLQLGLAIALPSEPHANLHDPEFLIPRDTTPTSTDTNYASGVLYTIPPAIETAINAFLSSTAIGNGTIQDLSLPGFTGMPCRRGNYSSAVSNPVLPTDPPCSNCSTVSGVLLASKSSTHTAASSINPILHAIPTPPNISRSIVSKRQAGVLYPLDKPRSADGNKAQEYFIRRLKNSIPDDSENNIIIVPSIRQLDKWRVKDRKGTPVPIGVTAEFFPFLDTPQTYKMQHLSGCTAVFVVSRYGMWAAHFWEASGTRHGFGSFEKYAEGSLRSDQSFKLIAADILVQRTPSKERKNRQTFVSLRDLAESHRYNNPFGQPLRVQVYILTKAEGPGELKNTQLYESKIRLLQNAISSIIPQATFNIRTYIGDSDLIEVPEDVNGLSIIQYSPFSGWDGPGREPCNRVAEVKIWGEINPIPALYSSWHPVDGQYLQKRQEDNDNGTCKLSQSSIASSESGITTSKLSSVTSKSSPSQIYHNTSAIHPTTPVSKNTLITHPATTVSKNSSTIHPPTTTKAVIPTCYFQEEDPDNGANKQGCVCGSSTLPLITNTAFTVISESCSYTAMPSSSVANPITTETEIYTTNCQACTLVGGVLEVPKCTSVSGCTTTASASPTPSFAIFLSNNSVPIGDEGDANSGKDMRDAVYSKLKALCPDNASSCDSKTTADIDEIPTVVGNGVAYEKLSFTIQDSNYNSAKELEQMLAAAIATWQLATNKSCQVVEFKDQPDQTISGCGKSPVKRSLPSRLELAQRNETRAGALLDTRSPICDECVPHVQECTYHATICSSPDHINPVLAGKDGAYSNHMNIQLEWKLDGDSAFNQFICDLIVDGLSEAAMLLAPELAGPEIMEELEFQSLCADMEEEQTGT